MVGQNKKRGIYLPLFFKPLKNDFKGSILILNQP